MTNAYFAKTNILNSKSLDDIKNYAVTGLDPVTSNSYDFFSTNDFMNAHLWQHEPFNYFLNDYGFREDSFPTNTSLAAFGCSFTFGTGLPKNRLWHQLLADKQNVRCLNFGLPGRSIASIVDMFLIASKHINIDTAVFLLPSFTRSQLAMVHPKDNTVINYIDTDVNFKSTINELYGIDSDIVYRALSNEELLKIARDKIYLLDYVLNERNTKVYITSWNEDTYNFLSMLDLDNITLLPRWQSPSMELAETDLARDMLHPGIKHHELFADTIHGYINV